MFEDPILGGFNITLIRFKNTIKTIIVGMVLTAVLLLDVSAQSVYEADWSTVSNNALGSASVQMTLSSGAAVQGITSYAINITANNRLTGDPALEGWFDFTGALPSIPGSIGLTSGGAGLSLLFTPSAAPTTEFLGTTMTFYNLSSVQGILLNPVGNPTSPGDWPVEIRDPADTSGSVIIPGTIVPLGFDSQSFGFETVSGTFGPEDAGFPFTPGDPISREWDEKGYQITQTFSSVPEPSSALLLGLGSFIMLSRRKRSRCSS